LNLHSRHFERRLRRDVKRTIRSSPELKREFRANNFSKHYNFSWALRPAFSAAVAFLAWQCATRTGHPASGIAILTLWSFGFTFIHAQSLWTRLYRSGDLPALTLLPLRPQAIFRWELEKFLRNSLWLALDLLVGYGTLAAWLQLPPLAWVAAVFLGVLAWAITLALAALYAVYLPRSIYQTAMAGILVVVVGSFIGQKLFGTEKLVAILDRAAPTLNLVLPVGWPGLFLQLFTPERQWLVLGLWLPAAALLWRFKHCLAALASGYDYIESVWPDAPDLVPDTADSDLVTNATETRRVGRTEIEEIVQTRQFLARPQWRATGRLETWLWHWLNERERALIEFAFPEGLQLSRPWRTMFRNYVIAVGVGLLAGWVSPLLKLCVIGLGLFVCFCAALHRLVMTGRSFQTIYWSGVNVPLYAGFPTGLRELSRMFFKLSSVQVPALILWTTSAGGLIAHLTSFPILDGILYGLRAGCLMFASRFIFMVFSFSSGTNDTARFRFSTVLLIVTMATLGGLFLLLGGFGFFLPQPALAWGLTFAAMLEAYAFFLIYACFYKTGRFDLMNQPKR